MRYLILLLSCFLFAQSSSSESQFNQEILQQSQTEFATKLNHIFYKNLKQKGNVLFSPSNIYAALALVHLGANGNTRDEIAKILGWPTTTNNTQIQQFHETLSQLLKTVQNTSNSKVDVFGSNGWESVISSTINVANGIFVQNGLNLVPSYVTQVQSYYKGQVSNVDFNKEPAKATDVVNQFISNNTNGRIPKLFSSPLSSDVQVLIAASLYFKAAWDDEFSEQATKDDTFNDGSKSYSVKMMEKYDDIPHVKIQEPNLQLESIILPYAGFDTAIHYVLPSGDQSLDGIISSLNATIIQRIVKESQTKNVHMKIPRMKYKWQNDLNSPLNELGLTELFTDNAKLDNLVSGVPLKVSQVTHAAEIEIHEKGTEASAVTVVKIVPAMAHEPKPRVDFFVNRPFLYFIRHKKTETILFMGVVSNPNGVE